MGKKPNKRQPAKIVSFDEAKRKSRRDIVIARGKPKEGGIDFFMVDSPSGPTKPVKVKGKKTIAKQAAEVPAKQQKEEAQQEEKKSRFSKIASERKEKAAERKRMRNKAKADRQFDKHYASEDSKKPGKILGKFGKKAQQPEPEGGPRAAVYKGEMGAKQRKSSRMQSKGAGKTSGGVSLPQIVPHLSRRMKTALASVALLGLFVFALYGPAQQYYLQMRETDRLQAEYAAVSVRSDFLQSSIDTLQSDEGVEDKAHTDLGYVKKNEHTASVKGANIVTETEMSTNVVPGSIPAPETWYSPVLDPIFGYSN